MSSIIVLRAPCTVFGGLVATLCLACGTSAGTGIGTGSGTGVAAQSSAEVTTPASVTEAAAAGGGGGASARSTPIVPTTEDPLPTGEVSGVEVGKPGQVSMPPGGSNEAPKTNPYCPDDINSGAATCQSYIDLLKAKRIDFCTYQASPKKDSEGDNLPFPDLAALQAAGAVANQCCQAGLPVTDAC